MKNLEKLSLENFKSEELVDNQLREIAGGATATRWSGGEDTEFDNGLTSFDDGYNQQDFVVASPGGGDMAEFTG